MRSGAESDPALDDQVRLTQDLDQFLQAPSLVAARDLALENPALLGAQVADYLSEAATRLRQIGGAEYARRCEFWLGILRTFRELGVQNGYFELAIDGLVGARTNQEHRDAMALHPDLKSEAATTYIERRRKESFEAADLNAENRYRFAQTLLSPSEISDSKAEIVAPENLASEIFTPEIEEWATGLGLFFRDFVQETDRDRLRAYLEARPELLSDPGFMMARSMFKPIIERARDGHRIVALRDLLFRQALFDRCKEAGIGQAFQEMAQGVIWETLRRK
jgi:hypothetical protein